MMRLVAPLVVLALSFAASAARADTPAEAAFAQLDGDAPVYGLLTPAAESAFWTWARKAQAGDFKGMAEQRARDVQALLGVDTTTGWEQIGLDGKAPVAFSYLAIDTTDAQLAYKALTGPAKGVAKAPRVWSRTRFVATVADEVKLRTTLETFAQKQGKTYVVGSADPAVLATVLGQPAKRGKALVAAWKKQKDLLAIIDLGTQRQAIYGFVRLNGTTLTVDMLMLFGGITFDWKKDGKALVKLVARPIKEGGALAQLQTPSGKALAQAEAGLLLTPAALLDLGRVHGWQKMIQVVEGAGEADKARMLDMGNKELLRCDEFRPLAAQGPMSAVALVAARSDTLKGVGLGAVWTLRDQALMARTLATSDEGLVDLAAAASGPQFLAVLALKDTAGLRALPRPGILAKPVDLHTAVHECGFAGGLTMALFGPLHMAAMHLDAEPALAPLFQTITNAALAVRITQSGGKPSLQGLLLGAFSGQPFHAKLDTLGKRGKKTVGKRELLMWRAKDGKRTFVATPGASKNSTVYGAVVGGDGTLDWWWGQPTPPSAGGQSPFVFMARGDLVLAVAVMQALEGGEDPLATAEMMRSYLNARLPGVTDFRATLKVAGDALIANVVLIVQ
jgi:hypothetical protein